MMNASVDRREKKISFLFLLISLLMFILLVPFLSSFIGLRLLINLFYSIFLIFAVQAVSQSKSDLVIAASLAVPMFAANWAGYVIHLKMLEPIAHIAAVLFIGFIIVKFLHFVLSAKKVSSEVIYAAVTVYLLFGLLGGILHSLLEIVQPGSYTISAANVMDRRHLFHYFSFITLTTLGYGDITPATKRAGSLAIVEAIVGQLYLTILVARLVGLHISHNISPQPTQNPPEAQKDSEPAASAPKGGAVRVDD